MPLARSHPHLAPDPTPHLDPTPADAPAQLSPHTPGTGPLCPSRRPIPASEPGIYCPEHPWEAKSRGGGRHGGVTHCPGPAVTATLAVTPVLCHAEPCPARSLCLQSPAQHLTWVRGWPPASCLFLVIPTQVGQAVTPCFARRQVILAVMSPIPLSGCPQHPLPSSCCPLLPPQIFGRGERVLLV